MRPRRVSAETPLGGIVSAPAGGRRITRRRVERSLRRSLEILAARLKAGYPSTDYQLLVEVCGGGRSYEEFERGWDRRLRRASGDIALNTRSWPRALAPESRATIVLPLALDRSGRYRLALEPIWTVTDRPSLELDLWVASSVDRWIRWMFTALSSRTARLARPLVERVTFAPKRSSTRWPLNVQVDWPLPPDEGASLEI